MSDLGPDLPDDDALAAEHALGVLTTRERAAAEQRMARDPAFAADVLAWRARLAPLVEEVASVTPPSALSACRIALRPYSQCCFIKTHSSGVSLPGLRRIASGVATLPTSWSGADLKSS